MRHHSQEKSDTLSRYVFNESIQREIPLNYTSIKGKPDNLSGNHLHLNLFLNSVNKYRDIYDSIHLLALNGVVEFQKEV